ncbi:double-stranded RNA-binding protein 1 isoform X2 [Arachis hypogaea]|uniref:double-stranded RNA-binding protein 1 isoform X2 n=1 Tax=Arachis hypogaea TaxID=3818 RepID=UPI003B2212CB
MLGVSNCYVFKSRLQEYAQKVGLPTPVYETIKEGPSHEPSFRSTVIVNDVRYDSLAGFFNRKAAEQSAAEVALMELAKTNEVNQSIKQPVHETGLCKNLLQEYAQKMNYAMPMYHSQKDETPSRAPRFTCTVDIGGILYIGGAAKTKKEAEIKAARTALLAIQSSASSSQNQLGHSQLTVIPCRKRAAETVPPVDETSKPPKPKKRFRKKSSKRKFSKDKTGRNAENAGAGANINPGVESHANISNESGFKETKCDGAFISEAMKSSENGILLNYCEKEVLVKEGSPVMNGNGSVEIGNSTKLLSKDPEASVEMNKQQDNGEIINEL